ncbi:helix-turn-helix domain-containing protein [Patulibacter brassicae]|uniref:helix-turn-helix domain-containing protein n=1 Tax=Patulibacter brassicae TaxID=1705717 RepID=UPI003873015C
MGACHNTIDLADLAAFAANVRAAREASGFTQEDVADRSGIHPTEVSRIERGLRDPRISTVLRLAKALDVPPSSLIDGA